jgi:uncharacterized protein (TIGR02145 family)
LFPPFFIEGLIYTSTYPLTQRSKTMYKLLLTTAAVAAAIAGAVAGEPSFGTFTDTRDGQTYKTVKMPDGKTWMAQNLNYKTDSSWCNENSADSCNKYGRVYDWNAAIIACPTGWKLPDTADWNKLVKAMGGRKATGKKLKSKSGWSEKGKGTDDYGFSALPAPAGGPIVISTMKPLAYSGWWTATEFYDHAYFRDMNDYNVYVGEGSLEKSYGFSVRCVADRP